MAQELGLKAFLSGEDAKELPATGKRTNTGSGNPVTAVRKGKPKNASILKALVSKKALASKKMRKPAAAANKVTSSKSKFQRKNKPKIQLKRPAAAMSSKAPAASKKTAPSTDPDDDDDDDDDELRDRIKSRKFSDI